MNRMIYKLKAVFPFDLFPDELVTVSYTHLRAHETVLDLVCRLLLEKKKHHTQPFAKVLLLLYNIIY